MKRFWTRAQVVESHGRYSVQLDSRAMRLPGGPLLALESVALAEAVAAEWQAAGLHEGGVFSAEDVPLTRLAGTAQERIAPDPAPTVKALARYGEADLLCYRACAPPALVERQASLWQPWLDWARDRYGATLNVTSGVVPVAQDAATLHALHRAVSSRGPFEVAGLGVLVPALGSLVLGLAVADDALTATEAYGLSLLDETFQAESWGEDRDATARRLGIAGEVEMAARFVRLSKQSFLAIKDQKTFVH